jgi:hypothetical protein
MHPFGKGLEILQERQNYCRGYYWPRYRSHPNLVDTSNATATAGEPPFFDLESRWNAGNVGHVW